MTTARWARLQWCCLAIGVLALLALLLCGVVGAIPARQAWLAYLVVYLFCLAPALGSMALLMVHALTGGCWGDVLRPPLLAATRLLPLLAVLWLPLLLGIHALYPWAQGGPLTADPLLPQQRWYLNEGFFIVRAGVCFALWLWLARGVRVRLRDPRRTATLARFAAGGLIVYALSMSVAATDWLMSLVPAWRSSVFGLIVGSGQILSATALAALCVTLMPARMAPAFDQKRLRQDLGNLLLALVLAWSYLAFMDYLTAWVGDLPSETVWYLPRLKTSWAWLGALLAVFYVALPFALLLSRQAKRRAAWLGAIAALLLAMYLPYVFWLVMPNFRPHGFALRWSDPLALLGVLGLCMAAFFGYLRELRVPANVEETAS